MSLGLVLNVPWLKIASVVTATVLTWNTGYVGAPSLKEGGVIDNLIFLPFSLSPSRPLQTRGGAPLECIERGTDNDTPSMLIYYFL